MSHQTVLKWSTPIVWRLRPQNSCSRKRVREVAVRIPLRTTTAPAFFVHKTPVGQIEGGREKCEKSRRTRHSENPSWA